MQAPKLFLNEVYNINPDGSNGHILALNQKVFISVSFMPGRCDERICPDTAGCGSWRTCSPYAFDATWPGADSVINSGTDQCGLVTNGPQVGLGYQVSELGGSPPGFGSFATYSTPGTKTVTVRAIGCSGIAIGTQQTFTFTIGAALYDPHVSNLTLPGSATLTTDPNLLATLGNPVVGVAADGVSLALLKIPTQNVGDSITVAVQNDQNAASTSTDEDGAVGVPGDTSYSKSSVTVSAVNTNQGPYGFVVYRSPIDFARLNGGVLVSYKSGKCFLQSGLDSTLPCRAVPLLIQTPGTTGTGQTNSVSVPVTIVRPPVVLVHGLWSNPAAWDTFAPLFSSAGGTDPRFRIAAPDFSTQFNGQVVASDPVDAPHSGIKENALGFAHNTGRVQSAMLNSIQAYRKGDNPINAPVSAAQVDVVGHSMGGNISRTLPLQIGYLDWNTSYQGYIHKLITIDTPHLGSPLATDLLLEANKCTRGKMNGFGDTSIRTLTLNNGTIIFGAIGDLSGDGTGGGLSPALINLQQPGFTPVKTAFIVGIANSSNFASLFPATFGAEIIIGACVSTTGGPSDPLALALRPDGWPALFPSSGSDAIVPVISQMNGLTVGPDSTFSGYVHTPSVTGKLSLGFSGPSVLDLDPTSHTSPVALQTINLLNTPVTQSPFNSLNP